MHIRGDGRNVHGARHKQGRYPSLFLSKSAEKSLPFFKILKRCIKKSDFAWTEEVEKALKDMKKQMAELPTITTPIEEETLIMYLFAAEEAISVVLLGERGDKQMPIYFVGMALQSLKVNYSPMEKLILALVHAARRLRRYFQAYPVVVITDQLIKQILSRKENSGRLAKWAIELEVPTRGVNQVEEAATTANQEITKVWKLFTYGSSNEGGLGARLILTSPDALLAGLRITEIMEVKHIEAFVDSKLVANQINNLYQTKEETMQLYLRKAKDLTTRFRSFSITQVPRSQNKQADALSKMASMSFAHLTKKVLVEIIPCKSIEEIEVMAIVEEGGDTWMTPIIEYLENGTLPKEKGKARRLRARPRQYVMLEGTLYRKSFLGPWLRCVGLEQAKYVIREIHKGSYSMHSGPRSVVTKVMQLGYYWPTMHMDARMVIRAYQEYQVHRPIPRLRKTKLKPITSLWPFHKWGIDICGMFLKAAGEGIKAQIGKDNKDWVEELPHVLWAHRTMIKSSNRNTPFSLTYGTKEVIPVEIRMPSLRCSMIDKSKNDEGLLLNLELLEEKRELATIAEEKHKRKMERYYNLKVWSIVLNPRDLVYRSNEANKKEDTGKLGPKWEVPYEVIEAL
ncbi:reverse transcriptase domain-containing protein [Tanacetum coccineum]